MRGGPVLFVLALAAAAAAWFLGVLPAREEAAAARERLAAVDLEEARAAARAWPGPTGEEAAAMERAARDLAAPGGAPPEGIEVDPRGLARGTLPWDRVQELFAWAADQPRPVLSIEVDAREEDPGLADCRVVFEEAPR